MLVCYNLRYFFILELWKYQIVITVLVFGYVGYIIMIIQFSYMKIKSKIKHNEHEMDDIPRQEETV